MSSKKQLAAHRRMNAASSFTPYLIMKTLLSILIVAIFIGTAIPSAEAREPVSIDFFYDNLEPYGAWLEVGDYGYCWRPYDVDADWSPYSDGRWVYTDAGWTWDSEEPYGWAVYHYGRWMNVDNFGWIWVPDTEWGPGWVSWRHSPEYIGWAPLPPEAFFRISIGFGAWVDDYYDIGPRNYRFVQSQYLGSRRLSSVFIDQSENYTIINQTTNITNITYVNNTVHNGGLRYDQQLRQSSDPIPRYTLNRLQDFEGDGRDLSADSFRSRVDGDSLNVFAPQINEKASSAPKKLEEKRDRVEVNHGWKNAGSTSEIAQLRSKLKSKVKIPEALPTQPRFESDVSKSDERDAQRALDRITDQKDKPGKGKGPENRDSQRPDMPPSLLNRKPETSDIRPDKKPIPRKDEAPDKPKKDDRNMQRDQRDPRTDETTKPNTERKPIVRDPRMDVTPKSNEDRKPNIKINERQAEPHKEKKREEPIVIPTKPNPTSKRPDELKPRPQPQVLPEDKMPQPAREKSKPKGKPQEKMKELQPDRSDVAPQAEPQKRKEPERRKKPESAPAPTKQNPTPKKQEIIKPAPQPQAPPADNKTPQTEEEKDNKKDKQKKEKVLSADGEA